MVAAESRSGRMGLPGSAASAAMVAAGLCGFIQRCRSRRQSRELLNTAHRAATVDFVRRWHRNKAVTEDLVQDTVVRALANTHQRRPGTDLSMRVRCAGFV
jgi:hypothetical protein